MGSSIVKTMRRLLIILIIAFTAIPLSAKKTQKEATVTYMSFNIRFITPKDEGDRSWESRRPAVINMFNDVQPDVVGIQEQSEAWVTYLRENLKDYDFYIPDYKEGVTLPKNGFSMVIFWKKNKFELLDCGRFFLSETPDKPSKGWDSNHYRNTAWVELKDKATGRRFFCFDTHLDHKGLVAKENGVLLNVEMIRGIAGKRGVVFLGGDMNIIRTKGKGYLMDPYYAYMQSAQDTALDSDTALTFNGYSDDLTTHRCLDYIFYRGAEALKFDVVDHDGYGVRFISDHYPVMATFRF
ncbi:MAG: endonuclease/exonuclease/phosphatase family protein [Bacteroidales bacterium]|nr:endonuclease/exonuclease/phosphatase family protein [Bacteroidales bacterium]